MKKRILAAAVCAALTVSLAGCSGNNESTANVTSTPASAANSTPAASTPASSKTDSKAESKPNIINGVDWSAVPIVSEADFEYEIYEIDRLESDWRKRFPNGFVEITNYLGDAEYINLPQTLAGKNVISISNDVNWGDNAKSIKFPDGLFDDNPCLGRAKNVTSIVLPDDLEELASWDFPSMETIVLPKGLKEVTGPTKSDNKLKSVTFGENIEKIGGFTNCTSLETVNFPSKLAGKCKIGGNAFSGCTALKIIELPEGCYFDTKSSKVFSGCTALEKVTLPNSVDRIRDYAFSGCTALKEVTLPSKLKGIEDRAFQNCISLKKIDIPDSVTLIEYPAFGGCAGIEITFKGKTYNLEAMRELYDKDLLNM